MQYKKFSSFDIWYVVLLVVTCGYRNTPITKKTVLWSHYRHILSHFGPECQNSVRRARMVPLIEFMNSVLVSGINHGHHSKVESHSLSI